MHVWGDHAYILAICLVHAALITSVAFLDTSDETCLLVTERVSVV